MSAAAQKMIEKKDMSEIKRNIRGKYLSSLGGLTGEELRNSINTILERESETGE
jgi:hypothetical protein